MKYTWENKLPIQASAKKSIFLAGSMDLDPQTNWRKEFMHRIGEKYDYYDPTNAEHNSLSQIEMETHINWELKAMEDADYIFVHLLPGSKSPISLVELGSYTQSGKLTVVCSKGFYQSRYVNTLCKRYAVSCYEKLADAIQGYIDLT